MIHGTELRNAMEGDIRGYQKGAFWWLGQMSYVLKTAGKVLYLDPFLTDLPERLVPPLLKPQQVNNADFIFGSHDHLDHIDRGIWHQLSISSPKALFVVPQMYVEELSESLDIPLHRFRGVSDGITVSLAPELSVTGIPSAHELLNQDPLTGEFPCMGFLIEGDGCRYYHPGDTCMYEGLITRLKKYTPIDIMFLPINGRDGKRFRQNTIGNLTYQEAVDLAGQLEPQLVIPGHYEMFQGNQEDPALFLDYLDAKYPQIKSYLPVHGEKNIYFSKNRNDY